jgi:hypothetical protein
MNKNNEKLISINEVIERAKKLGVDFGKADPKNRIRYYVKLGILPNAKRKIFRKNGKPEGAYPEEIVWKLFELDRKIKAGKTILEIKKEIEEKEIKRDGKENTETGVETEFREPAEKIIELPKFENNFYKKPEDNFSKKLFLLSLPIFFAFLAVVFLSEEFDIKKSFLYLSSLVNSIGMGNLAQLGNEFSLPGEGNATRDVLTNLFQSESYLTINAETAIEGSLNVVKEITSPILRASDLVQAPNFTLTKEKFSATFSTQALTTDRTYTFPDQSGTVCLSTGNCIGLGGEVTSAGGTTNRLAKFLGPRNLSNSSISDLFTGVSITIDAGGNVGIGTTAPRGKLQVNGNLLTTGMVGVGTDTPQYPLHVSGRIQATGDICTDLGGGKCLSQLVPSSPPVITPTPVIVAGGRGGILGSGSTGYIAIWTNANTLGNSILSQSGSTLTLTGDMTITGFLTVPSLEVLSLETSAFKISTTTEAGFILTAADEQGNIIFAPPPTGTIPVGTKLLRASLPIFKYSYPVQTATTSFVEITNKISTSTLAKVLPSRVPNAQRKFALLIKFSDNIPTTASSSWRIDFDNLSDFDFEFLGQNLSSLDSGILHLQDEIENLTNDNWVLKVRLPIGGYAMRIFNIFLICYEEVQ